RRRLDLDSRLDSFRVERGLQNRWPSTHRGSADGARKSRIEKLALMSLERLGPMLSRERNSRARGATWCLVVALLAWAARDDVRAQLVLTEDTTITEVVPGGIHIEGDATVRIAPGGRVEGDITGDNPGLTTPRVVVEGGVVDGNIGDPFPGSVRIVSGLVTGDVVVIVFSVSIEGGVVLGRVDGLSADVLISGGFVGEALVSDFP